MDFIAYRGQPRPPNKALTATQLEKLLEAVPLLVRAKQVVSEVMKECQGDVHDFLGDAEQQIKDAIDSVESCRDVEDDEADAK